VALENQPVFQAPSIPKMGKSKISSSIFSREKTGDKPKLGRSTVSFVRPRRISAQKSEQLKVDTNQTIVLAETNRILIEIQKQLALDFANRIAERKQNLLATKKNLRRQKLVKKEAFVERGVDRSKIGTLGAKVLAPVKGIFDKILEFLSLVGAGIVINNAWNWLSKKENRDKLIKIFQFLKTYWKQIFGGILIAKAIGAIAKLVGFANTLRKIFNRLRGLKGRGGTNQGPKPGSPDFCQGVMKCVADNVKSVVGTIAAALVAGGYILSKSALDLLKGGLLGQPVRAKPTPTSPSTQTGQSIDEIFEEWQKNYKPGDSPPINTPAPMTFPGTNIPYPSFEQQTPDATTRLFNSLNLPSWAIPIVESLVTAGLMSRGRGMPLRLNRPTPKMQRPQINLGSSTSSSISPQARRTGADFSVTERPPAVNLDVGASSPLTRFPRGSTPSVSSGRGAKSSTLGKNPLENIGQGARNTKTKTPTSSEAQVDYKQFAKDISIRAKQFKDNPNIYNVSTGANRLSTKRRLLDIYHGRSSQYQTLTDRASARRILNTKPENGGFGMNLPEIQPGANPRALERQLSEGVTSYTNVQGRSKGGTVFGQGSQTTDSVPAMLAPGEEVIRSSAANLFRPLLKDINDNAGRMWSALSNAIGMQTKNNQKQELVNEEFGRLTESFNRELIGLINEKKAEKLKNIGGGGLGGAGDGGRSSTPIVRTQKRKTPKQIQTYRRGRGGPGSSKSGEGKVTTINMTQPALNLAGQQTPESPPIQPSQSSSPSITIRSYDESNPYIMNNYAIYGIVL